MIHSFLCVIFIYLFFIFYFTEINECALDTDNCNENAACTNTPGSFNCTCNPGFTGDGVTCDGI